MSGLASLLHAHTLIGGVGVLVAAVAAGLWLVTHEQDLAAVGRRRATSWAVGPAWLTDPRWWSVIVALAVARMLGDGVPLGIAGLVGLGSGVLMAVAGGRFVLLVVIPALVVEAVHVARGSVWLTGIGALGWLVVPAVAIVVWTTSSGGPPGGERRLRQWWPETVATATFAAVELALGPARLGLHLHAMAPPAWLWVPALAVAVVACWRTARHGRAIVGAAIALLLHLVVQLAEVEGAYDGPLRTAVVVVAVMGGLLLSDAALAPRRRLA
jgi:hypothetical protein